MPDSHGKPEPEKIDPSQVEKLLEIELMQKRMQWQQAKGRNSTLRNLSYIFLLLVIAGAALAYFFLNANR